MSSIKSPRPLTINWIFPRPNLSGGIKSNRLIAEAMVRRGHQVNLLYPDMALKWPKPWRLRQVCARILSDIKQRGQPRVHHLLHSTANIIKVSHPPITVNDVPDADLSVATWWATVAFVERLPASKGEKAYFIRHHELHGGDPVEVAQTYRKPWLKLVIAKWLQRLMEMEYGDPNAVLVHNGVDWTQFDSQPRDKNPRPRIGFLYGTVPWKGAETALAAVRLLKERLPELEIVMFGQNNLAHTLPPDTTFYHRPAQDEIPKIYQSTDCWIVPSTLEGFGMPGIEAAASHCPVVSTRCGGPEDYVQDGVNGYLVDVDDVEAMAQRVEDILRMSNDAWREMSAASYRIAQDFNWDQSAEVLEKAIYTYLDASNEAGS